jgi:hypothetical protein
MKYLILLFLMVSSAEASVCKRITKIYYGNGMFNSWKDIRDSEIGLKNLDFSALKKDGSTLEFATANNLEESPFMNILSVVAQALENDYRAAWRILLFLKKPPESLLRLIYTESSGQNYEAMKAAYEDDLKNNKRVILVSHSQGNFYADSVMNQMFGSGSPDRYGFANIQVATPALNYYHSPHVTFEDDLVLKKVNQFTGAPSPNLPAIGARPGPYGDPWGHNFVKAYLRTPESRQKIEGYLFRIAKKLQYPHNPLAFQVKVTKANDDYLFFNYKMGTDSDSEQMLTDQSNPLVQSIGVRCSDLKEGQFSLGYFAVFTELEQPYRFQIEVNQDQQLKLFQASTVQRKIDGSNYVVSEGDWPVVNMIPEGDHFELQVATTQYPPKKLN